VPAASPWLKDNCNVQTIHTADLCDEFGDEAHVAEPAFLAFGNRRAFGGPVYSISVFEDNTLVKQALESPGNGQVLVVDGGASLRCALLGGNLAELAAKNGWQGIVINGCVRDVHEINAIDIGVRAIGTCPRKSKKQGKGETSATLFFAGVKISPGDYIYADEDGIVVTENKPAPSN
jgi:regulator of ribonuclease activity A